MLERTSTPSFRRGSQKPTRLVVPEFATSEWENVHAVNAQGGIEMLEWQDAIMQGWTGRTALGRWSAPTCGGEVPRQNGKSLGVVEPRCNWGMLKLGEQIIYTSHLQKTSTETFEDMAAFFDQPPFRKYIKAIKTAIGREQIILKDREVKTPDGRRRRIPGGRIKFLARTRNGGRGQHGDLLIFDEALELSAESQGSFLPAISASKNPQTIYVSTPPSAASESSVFRGLREAALSGESDRLAWFEWSVDEIGDVRDKSRWYATNPSLGILIQEDTVQGECDQMDELTFAIERLGYWTPTFKADLAIDKRLWEETAVTSLADWKPRKQALAVKFSPDGSRYAVAGCVVDKDGNAGVELIETASTSHGTRKLAEELASRKDKYSCVVIDGQSAAPALIDNIQEIGVPKTYVIAPNAGDVATAASMLLDGLQNGTVFHTSNEGQEELDKSAMSATKRRIGTRGGWGFGGESTALEAVSLALFGAKTSTRNPSRKQTIL